MVEEDDVWLELRCVLELFELAAFSLLELAVLSLLGLSRVEIDLEDVLEL